MHGTIGPIQVTAQLFLYEKQFLEVAISKKHFWELPQLRTQQEPQTVFSTLGAALFLTKYNLNQTIPNKVVIVFK